MNMVALHPVLDIILVLKWWHLRVCNRKGKIEHPVYKRVWRSGADVAVEPRAEDSS